jgi:acyl carrier protein
MRATTSARQIVDTLHQQLARFSGRRPEDISPGLSLADDLGIQSVTAIELLCAVEDQLGVELDIDDYGRAQTVQDLVDELLDALQVPRG